ncbi:double-stranded DNA-dependent ATPase NDAI_0C04460 [Naumovozyma dairenensis CBS 421]|uniref:ATP-dependent helicase IRC3 n=1 Tax=Naumovozyma dairenensis (strain ATCC 10597 / BCRC 20456 / CBS 421 / NBRC 0211 / NRRL Y-12639) TaxID=1071378 RepID=G0W8J5_NAUDC|nr:hypothetical protein NDAI_0C04460 [Naumovozyma dairenensis CBS 421]CCD24106.1 hypothetical protein NDAI_0C04460 [Naumovozyma dairenensis CBS 421]
MLKRLFGVSSIKYYQYSLTRKYSSITLRDYQQDAIDACVKSIQSGQRRVGVSLATGGGKTVIFSNLINQMMNLNPGTQFKTLILVHRRELALQATNTIKKFFPNLRVQIEMGKYHSEINDSDVVVASVQSIIRRLDKYKSDDINLIIIDEAHHAVANSYIKILEHFHSNNQSSKIPVVGFSATFERADKKALSDVMDKIVYHRGIMEMIDDKWLCEGKFTSVNIDVDLSKVDRTSGSQNGDFQIDSLSKVMNTEEVGNVIINTYLHQKKEHNLKSTLLFGVDIAHVESLYEIFKKNGINARYVVSNTKNDLRDEIIREFREGKVSVLMNCGIFTEGTDIPNIDSIMLCRPTRSRSLLVQMIGRGLRLHHSKNYCHIIDFIAASDVGVVSVPTLAGVENYRGQLDDATLSDLHEIKKEMDLKQKQREENKHLEELQEKQIQQQFSEKMRNTDAWELTLTTYEDFKSFCGANNVDINGMSNAQKEVELIHNSSYPWVKFSKSAWALSLKHGHHLRIYKEPSKYDPKGSNYILKLYRKIPGWINQTGASYSTRILITSSDLFKIAANVEEVLVNLSNGSGTSTEGPIRITKFARWRAEPATPRQSSAIKVKLEKELAKCEKDYKYLDLSDIDKYIKSLTKGNASNILFAMSLAPSYPLRSLLKAIQYKKTI